MEKTKEAAGAAKAQHYKPLAQSKFIWYGIGDIGNNFIYMMCISYVMYFCSEVNLMSTAIIGTVTLVSKIWDAVNDTMIGTWCNRTQTKMGRFRPWIIAGVPPTAVTFVLMFTKLPMGWSEAGKNVYICVLFCAWTFFFSMIYIGYGGLPTVMTINTAERGKLNAYRIGLGQITSVALSWVMTYVAWLGQGDLGKGFFWLAFICAVLGSFFILLNVRMQEERVKLPVAEKVRGAALRDIKNFYSANLKNGQYWIVMVSVLVYGLMLMGRSSVYAYYFQYVGGDVNALGTYNFCFYFPLIFGALLTPLIVRKIFKHKGRVQIVASVVMGVSFLIQGLMPYRTSPVLFMFLACVTGFMIGVFNSNAFAATADCVEYTHWKYGVRNEGIMMSQISFWMKLGMGIGTFMVGVWITAAGYSGGLEVQPESAVNIMNFIMTFFGAILAFVMAVVYIPYKLSEKNVEKYVTELDQRGEIKHDFEIVED